MMEWNVCYPATAASPASCGCTPVLGTRAGIPPGAQGRPACGVVADAVSHDVSLLIFLLGRGVLQRPAVLLHGGAVGAAVDAASGKFIDGEGTELLAPGTATKLDCMLAPGDTILRAWSKFVAGVVFMTDRGLL